MTEPTTAVEIARRLADALENAAIPYAIGGALALAYYAPPRATVDVDINIFVAPEDGLERVMTVLAGAGFAPDTPQSVSKTALEDGQFRGRVEQIRVDVFVPSVPVYGTLADHRRRVPLLGRSIDILGAEDLLILKLMFFRRKDLADAEAVLRNSTVDRSRVRDVLVDMVGEEDERVREWDEIVNDVGSTPT